MKILSSKLVRVLACVLLLLSCGGDQNPIAPDEKPDQKISNGEGKVSAYSDCGSGGINTCGGYYSPGNPYPCCNGGNCTWWAWYVATSVWGDRLPGEWGNAASWADAARASGYPVYDQPAVHTIGVNTTEYVNGACDRPQTGTRENCGHVAWITAVLPGAQVRVTEMVWGKQGARNNKRDISYFNAGFIYPKRCGQQNIPGTCPTPPTPPPLTCGTLGLSLGASPCPPPPTAPPSPPSPPPVLPTLVVDGGMTSSRPQGNTFSFTGTHFTVGRNVTPVLSHPNGQTESLAPLTANAQGVATWTLPTSCTSLTGTYAMSARDDATGKFSNAVACTITANVACTSQPPSPPPTIPPSNPPSPPPTTQPSPPAPTTPTIFVSPAEGIVGTVHNLKGQGFSSNGAVDVRSDWAYGLFQITADRTGAWSRNFSTSGWPLGNRDVWAVDDATGRTSNHVTVRVLTVASPAPTPTPVPTPTSTPTPTPLPSLNPHISVSPTSGTFGTSFHVDGMGFTAGGQLTCYDSVGGSTATYPFTVGVNGNIGFGIGLGVGTHALWLVDNATGRSSNTVTVIVLPVP